MQLDEIDGGSLRAHRTVDGSVGLGPVPARLETVRAESAGRHATAAGPRARGTARKRIRVEPLPCAQPEDAEDLLRAAFEAIPSAIVVLDRSGRILFATAAARAFLQAGCELGTDPRGRLVTGSRDRTAFLHRRLDHAAAEGSPQYIEIARDGRRPLLFTFSVVRLRYSTILLAAIIDPDTAPLPAPARVRALYDLTATEARVALGLAAGRCVERIAADLDVTVRTVRSHLERAMARTDSDTPEHLVRLLLRLGAGFTRT